MNEKGLSIVEFIVAITVLLFAIISLVYAMGTARGFIEQHGMERRAVKLAEEKLEVLREIPFGHADLTGSPSGVIHPTNPPYYESVYYDNLEWRRSWIVYDIDDEEDGLSPADDVTPDYKLILVSVTWIDFKTGKPASPVRVSTYRCP